MGWKIGVSAALAAGLLATAVAAEPGDPPGWETYHNDQNFFSVCYPIKQLDAQPESGSGDGRVFKGPNGSEVRAFAEGAGDQTLASELKEDIRERGPGWQVTYKVIRPGPSGWFAMSARKGDQIFYEKVYLVEGVFQELQFSYSQKDAAFFNRLIPKMNACFGIGGIDQSQN
jgi:hypothetical protein